MIGTLRGVAHPLRLAAKATSVSGLLLVVACNQPHDSVRHHEQQLTLLENRVLGFETPLTDWATTNGSQISASAQRSEGQSALGIVPNGYTEVRSTDVAVTGVPRSSATIDVFVPGSISWGEIRLIATVPSKGQYWRDLGSVSLNGLSSGSFHTVSFSVPQDLRSAFESGASDVSFRLVINAPSGSGQFLFDNLVLSDDGNEQPPTEPGLVPEEFALSVPEGTPVAELFMSATQRLTIDDRTTIGEEGKLPTIASVGPDTSEFGAGVRAHSNVVSEGSVDFLRSGAVVSGSVRTAGGISKQNDVVISGGEFVGTFITNNAIDWQIGWPVDGLVDFSHPPDALNVRLPPGAFDHVQVYSRATFTFESGTYFINSLIVEPQAHFRVDTSKGPIQIYVRNDLRLRVGLEHLQSDHDQVLFAYLGEQPALFEEALHAAVIAPRSAVELRRPGSGLAHRGAFFGEQVHVFSDATVEHVPLDLSFLCSATAPPRTLPETLSTREGNFYCPTDERSSSGALGATCYSATSAPEFLSILADRSTGYTIYYAGPGDDIVLSEEPGTLAFGQDGDDVLCALSDDKSAVHGGEGTDLMQLAGESVEAIPGPGADDIRIIEGHADILIKHACEIVSGESYRLIGGTATIHSPLSREEMIALGVTIDEGIEVEPAETSTCDSLCSGAPLCASHEYCADTASGGRCLARHPTFELSVPVDERYEELDADVRDDLRGYVDSVEKGRRGIAPTSLRWKAAAIVPVLLSSIMRNSRHDRAAEIYALGSLYRPESLTALETVALIHSPAGFGLDHNDHGTDWFLGQQHAVRWLAIAAGSLDEGQPHVDALLRVARDADRHTQELAVNALTVLDGSPEMRQRIAGILSPEDSYLLDLEFE